MRHAVSVVWQRETRRWLWSCQSEDMHVPRGRSHGIVRSEGAEGGRAISIPCMLTEVSSSRAGKAKRALVFRTADHHSS